MTDQERTEMELSLAMIDQAIATQDATASTQNLKDATDMESDASLDLTDSKERVMDQMNDLEYSLHEQNRIEKQYLNTMARRLEIESKIGLVDYSKIEKTIHDKIVKELEERLKAAEDKKKKDEEQENKDSETEEKRQKSEADYLKEAEKFHKKQKSVFKRIQDGHKNYMQNSKSLTGRLAMGAIGKGTSELVSLVDSATDMIPGAKTAKRVGGFVRDQWRESKELKRQDKIQKTAGFLKAKDEAGEIEKRKQKERDDTQKKGNEGIFGLGFKLEKILAFLKKLGESMMIMGLFRGMLGLIGNAVSGLAGLISSGISAALTGLGIAGTLKGILSVLKSGLGSLGKKFGFDIPDVDTVDEKTKNKDPKNKPKSPDKTKTPKGKPGLFKRAWDITKLGGSKALEYGGNALRGTANVISRGAGEILPWAGRAVGTAGLMLYSNDVGKGSDDVSKFADPNYRAEVAARNKRSQLEAESKEYKSSYGDKPLIDSRGNVYYYPNPNNDPDINVENERRFHMDTKTGMVENNEETFREVTNAATALQDAKDAREEKSRQAIVNTIGQQHTINNINNSYKGTNTFGFNPNEYSSRDNYSRGEIK